MTANVEYSQTIVFQKIKEKKNPPHYNVHVIVINVDSGVVYNFCLIWQDDLVFDPSNPDFQFAYLFCPNETFWQSFIEIKSCGFYNGKNIFVRIFKHEINMK